MPKKRKILWFSRHQPTAEQIAEIRERFPGFEIDIDFGIELGSRNLNNRQDLENVLAEIGRLKPQAIYGVFPTPILAKMHSFEVGMHFMASCKGLPYVPCFAAWNVNRAPEGERPAFQHKIFLLIGRLPLKKEW